MRERACCVRGVGADLEVEIRHRRGFHATEKYRQNEADDNLLGSARASE